MSTPPSEIIFIISVGTLLLLLLAGFITALLFIYKQRYRAHQQELLTMQEAYQRELLQSQLEVQNHTLQQVARDLHDNIGQLLTVVVMQLNNLEDEAPESATQQAAQQTRELVKTVITDVRALSKTLNHETVGDFGLVPSLTLELERIRRAAKLDAQLTVTGELYSLGKQEEMVLLRLTQESLNNALKHAQARHLAVHMQYAIDRVQIVIRDDGAGFDLAESQKRTLTQAGSGLRNLYRRAELLGGTCRITSQPGAGTEVTITVPVPNRQV